MLKTVFHVHTDYSHDSNITADGLIDEARRRGVGCITITDHDTIAGARAVAAKAGHDLKVIIGEEVSTEDGHLIGLFLREEIRPGLSARRTAELIRRQGGLVVVPHPFNTLFGCSLREKVYDVIDLVHAIEVCNSQNLSPIPDAKARELAQRFSLPALVGVDLHHSGYMDSCHQMLPAFEGPQGFLAAIRRAELVPGRHPLGYFARSAWYELSARVGLSAPAGYGRNCLNRAPSATPLGEGA